VPGTPDAPAGAVALEAANARLRAANGKLRALLEERDARIAALEAQVAELSARVARLERQASRNSGNSSLPPSSDDQPGKKQPAQPGRRTDGKRKPGKQPGAPGAHLAWGQDPDKTIAHFPGGDCQCGADLGGAADLGVTYSHQVTDIPEATATVTQHDRHRVRCRCGRVHVAPAPDGVTGAPGTVTYGLHLQALCVFLLVMHHVPVARCADIIESLCGARPSDGFVHALLARAARGVAAANKLIRALVILARVVCADETPIRVGPGPKTRKKYLLVACTNLLTYYFLGGRDMGGHVPGLRAAGPVRRRGARPVPELRRLPRRPPALHSSPAQGPGGRGRDLPGRGLARPDRRLAARPHPRREPRPRAGPGRRPR
jgi:hypothetical protein